MKKVLLLGSFLGASLCFAQDYSRPVTNLASDGVSNATIKIAEGAVYYDAKQVKSVIKGSNTGDGTAPLCTLRLSSSSDYQSYNKALDLRITTVTGTAVNPGERNKTVVALQLSKLSGAKTQQVATLTCKEVPVTQGYNFATGLNTSMVTIETLNTVLGGMAVITLAEPLIITEEDAVVEEEPKKGKN